MNPPWSVTTVTPGFAGLNGILFDGSNIWVTDTSAGTLLKLDQSGAILQTVNAGFNPQFPAFDGSNIWVPNSSSNTVSVVRAATGAVIATLSGNGLAHPDQAAFDGQRILVTNEGGNSIAMEGYGPDAHRQLFYRSWHRPCGGVQRRHLFWVTLQNTNQLARF
jgi:YVTN family beta-propeller protein